MTPESSTNLERFIKDYAIRRKCHIATPTPGGKVVTHLTTAGVVVRWAWEIDANDPEISAISLDDDVFIPEGSIDPPINRARAQIGSFRNR